METPNNLFKEKHSSEESEEKDPISKTKEEITQLRSELKKALAENRKEDHEKIGLTLGEQYFKLSELLANTSDMDSEKSKIKSFIYLAEAIKFIAEQAIKELLEVKDPTLFLTTFLLVLDRTGALKASLAVFRQYFDIRFLKRHCSGNFPAVILHDELLTHIDKIFEPKLFFGNLKYVDAEKLRIITTKFLTEMLNHFKPNIEVIYHFIQFSNEEHLLSKAYLLAYRDYFFDFAKLHPEEFMALNLSQEIIFFISEIYFANNEVMRDIECLRWLKDQLKDEKEKETIDEIFYERMLKCCDSSQLFSPENELFIERLENFLQYFEAISENFIIKPSIDLFLAIKTLYETRSFENIKIALNLTARICKGMPAEFTQIPDSPEKTITLYNYNQFIRFHNVCFQPDSLLSAILLARLEEIKIYIKDNYKKSAGFFKKIPPLALLENFEKLTKYFLPNVKPLVKWQLNENEVNIAKTQVNFEKIITDLIIFESYVENIPALKQLFEQLRTDIMEILTISPIFNKAHETQKGSVKTDQLPAENQKEKELEAKDNKKEEFDPSYKESKEEDDDASSALARQF